MRERIKIVSAVIFLMCCSVGAMANTDCHLASLAQNAHAILRCYLSEPESIQTPWVLQQTAVNAADGVTKQTYLLTSQQWPKEKGERVLTWTHQLILYRPKQVNTSQALLFINGGTLYQDPKAIYNPAPQVLNFNRLAADTQSIVVDLQDIPNQYLTFQDGVSRKEDGAVAYTWNQYMNDPQANAYWPLYLPMVKSVVRAMDAIEEITSQQPGTIPVKSFVLAGASKRGFIAWLTALSDPRVNGLIPVVIDLLNTKKNIQHIYQTYNHTWPLAFHDYIEQKVVDRIQSKPFEKLMQLIDPLTYLSCGKACDGYKERLSIPKYIISASGDDFFVPDSLSLYLDKLPGKTQVRVIPNQGHFIDMALVDNAILGFYKTFLSLAPKQMIQWTTNSKGVINALTTKNKPSQVILWEANNPKGRDFRLASGITYKSRVLQGSCQKEGCIYPVKIAAPKMGASASFVEATFDQADGQSFVLTSPAYVMNSRAG